jgi:hypothetical protein
VAVEDAVALTPSPDLLASWPSLYQKLCEIACSHGSIEREDDAESNQRSYALLLSQVKPLLQRHWHSGFDEFGLSYFTEEGSTIKLKKMKHLLSALLRWRSLRREWQASSAPATKRGARGARSAVDEALEMELVLVPSKTHNDILVHCVCHESPQERCTSTNSSPQQIDRPPPMTPAFRLELPPRQNDDCEANATDTPSTEAASNPRSPSCKSSSELSCGSVNSGRLEQELALLRSENAKLRSENNILESRAMLNDTVLQRELFQTPLKLQQPPPDVVEIFDDPFEPPPQIRQWEEYSSPVCSTPGSISFCSGTLTPFSESSLSRAASGYATPVPSGPPGQVCNGVTLVSVMPVWFQTIPTGVVQQARTMFERHAVIPSWFVQQE